MNAELLSCQALLNCLIREVSSPENQALTGPGHVTIRLPRAARLLRAHTRRPAGGIGPRLDGRCEVEDGGSWRPLGTAELAAMIAAELCLATGVANEEFAAQAGASQQALAAMLAGRAESSEMDFVASEQALVAGHRFHPAPKARQGAPGDWLRYAPEVRSRFPLRFLGVRSEVLVQDGDTQALGRLGGPVPPPGFGLLPAHPWQLGLLRDTPWFEGALRAGLVVDLGTGTRQVAPTSSVRTVYDPVADVFCKFSLNVRLTNCVRKSAWYELAGSVLLSELLSPVFGAFPEAVLLGEPGYRTVALAARDAYEGLAVIVRSGFGDSLPAGVTPLLAASLTEPASRLFDGRDPDWLAGWWQAYVRLVAAPVLGAYFEHGIVLEPHLQNVLAGVDRDGWPVRAIFRDLEGVKLVTERHGAFLAGLPAGVARGLGYDAKRGWDRVAYCLFVNHLAEVAAAIADRALESACFEQGLCFEQALCFEQGLWRAARDEVTIIAKEQGWPPELRALLAGVPLPAKANLRVRWARAADCEAGYVPVPNPLGGR
ncbi:MAG TPA: IucA/IucC family protein [Streptosporangiaceae bacterium]